MVSIVRRTLMLPEKMFNLIHGLDFDAIADMKEEGHNRYQPSSIWAHSVLRKYLTGKITDRDSIIDIGCGKGRMLYFFSQFPFRHVDGLEYSQALIEIAQNNFAILRTLRKVGDSVRIFQGDAALYDAYDDYTYFYLFHPFTEVIMTPFIHHVKESAARQPRDIYVLYHNPVYHDLLAAEGFNFVEELKKSTALNASKLYLYVLPAQNV